MASWYLSPGLPVLSVQKQCLLASLCINSETSISYFREVVGRILEDINFDYISFHS